MASQGTEVITDQSLANIATALRDTWPVLARELGFDQTECDSIIIVFLDQDEEGGKHMLEAWRERYDGVDMVGCMIGALRKIGRYDMLKELGVDQVFDDQKLDELAAALGEAWTTLAEHLRFGDVERLDYIMGTFSGQVDDQAREMLKSWRDAYAGIDWIGQLMRALKRMGRYDLLEKIGVEVFEDHFIENLGNALGEAWPTLADHMGFDDADCASISEVYSGTVKEQAKYMLTALRDRNDGLIRVDEMRDGLKKMGRYDLLKHTGVEILETPILRKVAESLGESWPKLAVYLMSDNDQCTSIKDNIPEPREQAVEMLVVWRENFRGDNPVEYLARALVMMDRIDLAQLLGPSLQLPQCPCGNADPFKMRRYFSKGDDDDTRLIGLCCGSCGKEWLQERFLFHLDVDNTRRRVKLNGVVLKEQLQVPVDINPVFQVKDCRTKIENFDYLGDYLKVGDHITWRRPWGIWHHAIVSEIGEGDGWVQVFHWTKSHCGVKQIMEKNIYLPEEWGDLFLIDYENKVTTVNTAELVIARAKSRVGDTGYNLFGDNCEAFASYCKTGVAESCQLVWLYNKGKAIVTEALNGMFRFGCDVAWEFAENMLLGEGKAAVEAVAGAEFFERLVQGPNIVGAGLVFVFEGIACYWDLQKIYDKRESGNISLKDFIETASRRVTEAVWGAGLAAAVGVGGQAVGGALGSFILPGIGAPVGAFLGSVFGGALGSLIGRPIGSLVGPHIGRAITWTMGTDDRAVEHIEDLKAGDQIVVYGNLLHPRHHSIVVDKYPAERKVNVIHNTYQNGVVEEKVDFTEPTYRLVYDERKCYPPDEVIERARSKIGDQTYRYSLAWNNCKDFARWCKLK